MASNIVEFFGFGPADQSPQAKQARSALQCPFLKRTCIKTLGRSGLISGVCTLKPKKSGPVICCPIRLYAGEYQILKDVALQAFGAGFELVIGNDILSYRNRNPGTQCIAVFGKRWGKELRLPNRSKQGDRTGAYFVDWVLAHLEGSGKLLSFVAIEVQSIDTTGNYQAERSAHLEGIPFAGSSTAGFNWENVNKRILPQIIYKGHVLRREPLCHKGLFFVCPTPVYGKIAERLGGRLEEIHQQPGSVTMMWYDVGPPVPDGEIRELKLLGQATTTVDQVALAFTAPSNLPPPKVYEKAILAEL
jgi:hypothetical protein